MATYHSKTGKFCASHEAHKVSKGGKRFRVTRVLEPDEDMAESKFRRPSFVEIPVGMIPVSSLFGG